jgi:hypothetical protein
MVKVHIGLAKTNEKTHSYKELPDHFTQISFYVNLVAFTYFLFWNLITLVALNNISIIEKYKQLSVLELIKKRGIELGFESGNFVGEMNQYYFISLILLIPVTWSLLLLRKKRAMFYPTLMISISMQILLMIILLGPTYFWIDSPFADKLMWLILIANSSLYRVILKKEVESGKISFFD